MGVLLKHCPFCGSANVSIEDIRQPDARTWVASVVCEECQVAVSPELCSDSEADAINDVAELWNRRVPARVTVEEWARQRRSPPESVLGVAVKVAAGIPPGVALLGPAAGVPGDPIDLLQIRDKWTNIALKRLKIDQD